MIQIQFPDMWVLTLEDLKTFLTLNDTEFETKRQQLAQSVRQASADVIAFLNRIPLPHVKTMEFEPPKTRFLMVNDDLLEVIELLNQKGDTISGSDYRLKPLNTYPKSMVELTQSNCGSWSSWCGTQFATMELTARFGYAPHWQYAWETVETGLSINDSATLLTVPDGSLFGIGDTLRMESEYLFVRDITPDPNPATTSKLSLRRGTLGTTAAAHSSVAIDRFIVLDVIRTNAIEWAAHLEKSRGRVGERVQVSEQGLLIVNDLSPLVKEALVEHKYEPTVSLP